MFAIISAMAEFERDLIRERVKAGIGRAKQKGVRLGRPPLMNDELRETVADLRDKGFSIRRIAKKVKGVPFPCSQNPVRFGNERGNKTRHPGKPQEVRIKEVFNEQ
jgi:hypothetical protein